MSAAYRAHSAQPARCSSTSGSLRFGFAPNRRRNSACCIVVLPRGFVLAQTQPLTQAIARPEQPRGDRAYVDSELPRDLLGVKAHADLHQQWLAVLGFELEDGAAHVGDFVGIAIM